MRTPPTLRVLLTTGILQNMEICVLSSQKTSSSYSLLKFVYVTSQLRHSLVVQSLLRKILDPSLNSLNSLDSLSKGGHVRTFWTLREGAYSRLGAF